MKPPTVNSVLRHVCSSRISDIAALEPVAKLETSLYESLTSRKTKTQWDSLDLTVANHLTKTLEKYLQKTIQLSKLPSRFNAAIPKLHLPPGYHQVYFNPAYEEGHLLSDGTDRAHSPGWPFEKRLWGGGSLIFNHEGKWMMKNGYLGILQEDIENVQVKGKEGEEKIFVTVSRKAAMGVALGIRRNLATQRWPPDLRTLEGTNLKEGKLGRLALEEKKTLVFMRTKTDEELRQSLEAEPRIIKAPYEPDFKQALTPTAHLLFRFSALTFNAHRIHLDRQYAREVEGHRNLLVHGPLTQVLMLQVLRSQLDHEKKETIYRFDYRNLAPLYADEKMKICTRRRPESLNKFDVWIEGPAGGLAVKATAEVGPEIEESDPSVEQGYTLVKYASVNPMDMKNDPNPSLRKRHTPVKSFDIKRSKPNPDLEQRVLNRLPTDSLEMKSILKQEPNLKPESTLITRSPMNSDLELEPEPITQSGTERNSNREPNPEPPFTPTGPSEKKSNLSHEIPERKLEPAPTPSERKNYIEYENHIQREQDAEVRNTYGYTAAEIAVINKRKYSRDADQDERLGW